MRIVTAGFLMLMLFCLSQAAMATNVCMYGTNGLKNGWVSPCIGVHPSAPRIVTNASGQNLCIPVYPADATGLAFWNSFIASPPPGVTVSACSNPVNGVCNTPSQWEGCVSGTVVWTGTPYLNCAQHGGYGTRITYDCMGEGGGTSQIGCYSDANICWGGSPCCCGSVPC